MKEMTNNKNFQRDSESERKGARERILHEIKAKQINIKGSK